MMARENVLFDDDDVVVVVGKSEVVSPQRRTSAPLVDHLTPGPRQCTPLRVSPRDTQKECLRVRAACVCVCVCAHEGRARRARPLREPSPLERPLKARLYRQKGKSAEAKAQR